MAENQILKEKLGDRGIHPIEQVRASSAVSLWDGLRPVRVPSVRRSGEAGGDNRSRRGLTRGRRRLGAGLLLAGLALLFSATSRGESDAQAQDGGAVPDGGAVGDTAKVASSVYVYVSGSVLPGEVVHDAMGPAPPAGANLAEWAEAACLRIGQAYHAADYDYARAWFSLAEKGLIWIHVDPGRMRVLFVGVGGVGAALFRLSLNLPDNVFRKPTVEHALQELKEKYGLVNITYRVRDLGESQITPFGPMVPDRLLQIYVVSREFLGWSLDVSVSAAWGVVPAVSYHRAGLLLEDDRLFTRVEFAFPYRQYLTEEEARLRWVHGGFDAAYRLPRRLQGRLALRLETSLYLSQYDRPDLDITTYDFLRSTTVPALVFIRPYLEVSLGAGADAVRIFQVERASTSATDNPALGDLKSVRALFRLVANLDPRALVLQRDQRPWLHLQVDTATSNIQKWLVMTTLTGQEVLSVGRQRFILRGRGVQLAGDARFWDEMQLASDYQRVFFGNRYWVRQAAQLETAYRVCLWRDWFAVGLFHDTSLFMDRSLPVHHPTAVDAFGPSMHFLLLDTFALDLYAGFGFSPVGFDQTVTFALQTIF